MLRSGILAIAMVASLGLAAAPASAHEPTVKLDEAVFTARDILDQRLDASDPESDVLSQQHLDLNARGGTLTDAVQISTAVLKHPADGSDIGISWEGNRTPEELFIGRATIIADEEVVSGSDALGVISSAEDQVPHSLISGGSGFGSGTAQNSGMYEDSAGCTVVSFSPAWLENPTGNYHYMTTCFQKFAVSGSDLWTYNRWTNFNIADQVTSWPYFDVDAGFVDFTIRARPNSGTNGNFRTLRDWAPRDADINCANVGNVTLGVSPFNVSIPIDQCTNSETLVSEGGNPFHFGRDYDGPSPRGQETMTLDAAIAFQASSTTVVPYFADYDWVELGWCQSHIAGATCFNETHHQWDSGW